MNSLMDVLKPYLASTVRHGLTVAGGIIIKDGLLPSDGLNDFVGGGMVFAGIAWSFMQKYGQVIVAREFTKLKQWAATRQAAQQAPNGAKA